MMNARTNEEKLKILALDLQKTIQADKCISELKTTSIEKGTDKLINYAIKNDIICSLNDVLDLIQACPEARESIVAAYDNKMKQMSDFIESQSRC